MKKIRTILLNLTLAHSLLFTVSAHASWFENQSSYSEAHKNLLKGNNEAAFKSIVEAWQQTPTEPQRKNLNGLLDLAITEDCGHNLDSAVLPAWLSKLSIERAAIQNTNQQLLKLSIVGLTRIKLKSINFSYWPDEKLIDAIPIIDDGGYFSVETTKLEHKVEAGLYKLSIETADDVVWNKWIVLSEPPTTQTLGWKDSNSWRIDHSTQPNSSCPAPILSIKMYDLNNTDWQPLWTEEFDTNLPAALPSLNIPEGRYWLDVGLIQSRWQGGISILDIQNITRSIDYTATML